jgi:hypothetical protein
MTSDSQLVHSLTVELKRKPIDFDTAKEIIGELTNLNSEQDKVKVTQLFTLICGGLVSEVVKAKESISEKPDSKTIKPNKLALVLKDNEYLLTDFDVVFDNNNENPKICYKGNWDSATIYRAYDYLRLELSRFIGYREYDNSTISRAIMQAKNYLQYDREMVECNMVDTFVIEKAYNLINSRGNRKNLTIPELKKQLTSITLTTKEVQNILLNAGWEIVKLGTCATKFFRPKY